MFSTGERCADRTVAPGTGSVATTVFDAVEITRTAGDLLSFVT
jgi:hypothetical protein